MELVLLLVEPADSEERSLLDASLLFDSELVTDCLLELAVSLEHLAVSDEPLEVNLLKVAVRSSILSASAASSSSSFFHPSFSHSLSMTWSQFPNRATSLWFVEIRFQVFEK